MLHTFIGISIRAYWRRVPSRACVNSASTSKQKPHWIIPIHVYLLGERTANNQLFPACRWPLGRTRRQALYLGSTDVGKQGIPFRAVASGCHCGPLFESHNPKIWSESHILFLRQSAGKSGARNGTESCAAEVGTPGTSGALAGTLEASEAVLMDMNTPEWKDQVQHHVSFRSINL